MYPKNLSEYMPTQSEIIVFNKLKDELPDSYEVFYSVGWNSFEKGYHIQSEADFIILNPDFGFLVLEVKGGDVRVQNNEWYISDSFSVERRLSCSPYEQAERSMYHFSNRYGRKYHSKYRGVYAAGVVFPFCMFDDKFVLNNRSRECTIDANDLDNIYEKINRIFRVWKKQNKDNKLYKSYQHDLLKNLIRENIAISAASGALTKYKEKQFAIVNRVQDNYVYFIKDINRFMVRGGAGTGKTWIAMKMALDAVNKNQRVLFLCVSTKLAAFVRDRLDSKIDVSDVSQLFRKAIIGFKSLELINDPDCFCINDLFEKYDAIFVDEGQDFAFTWAKITVSLLKDSHKSRIGIFYDEIQTLKEDSFGDGFGLDIPVFHLNENIRNTSSIYEWTSNNTNLGKDEILNPVEGPTPTTELIKDKGQLITALENILYVFLEEERLPLSSLVVIVDDLTWFLNCFPHGIAKWTFSKEFTYKDNQIIVSSIEDYKGLESDMVIYIHSGTTSVNSNYVAYTRAKFYLKELIVEYR